MSRSEAIIIPSIWEQKNRYEEMGLKVVGIRAHYREEFHIVSMLNDRSPYMDHDAKLIYLMGIPIRFDDVDSLRFETEVVLREYQTNRAQKDGE